MQYYHQLVTEKSFQVLQELRHQYQFILIGGWAVFLYTHSLKSKDIDLIIKYEELEKLRKKFSITKNDRLRKYEVKKEEIDVDIYLPHYSKLSLPVEKIKKYTQNLEGFVVPRVEILLILKQGAYRERLGSHKGEKDKIDLVSLLKDGNVDFDSYKKILRQYKLANYLDELRELLQSVREIPQLGLNQFKYSQLKKRVLSQI